MAGWQLDFGLERGFVGGGNAGEFFDLACTRFGVEPFGIALFANFQGRVKIDFKEFSLRRDGAGQFAIRAVG